jgi:hypothetical protein
MLRGSWKPSGTMAVYCPRRRAGKSAGCRQLKEMLAYEREGEIRRMKPPDRLAQPTTDLLGLVQQLEP